jgi:arabinose-5-phosphate isomerase
MRRSAKVLRLRSANKPKATKPSKADVPEDALAYARGVFRAEADAILHAGERLGRPFERALELLLACKGHVVVTGMGKSGFIAQKMSATLASTGIPSLYLHPAEALHGDLGRVASGDVVLALSNSGATEELLRLLPGLRRMGAQIISLTGDAKSPLGVGSDVALEIGSVLEACPMGLVPTASSAALLALCDALAMTLLKCRPISRADYAVFHPGGSLGRAVMRVEEVMRTGSANPRVIASARLAEAVAVMTKTPGRPGATNVVDAEGLLVGIFTDGDLRRLVEKGETDFERPVSEVMGKNPRRIQPSDLVQDAATLLREARVDQLPVADALGRCVGLLDIQDLLSARVL